MEVQLKKRCKYEIDCNENNEVMACFCETRSLVYDEKGNLMGDTIHRDVVELDYMKKLMPALEKMPYSPPNLLG